MYSGQGVARRTSGAEGQAAPRAGTGRNGTANVTGKRDFFTVSDPGITFIKEQDRRFPKAYGRGGTECLSPVLLFSGGTQGGGKRKRVTYCFIVLSNN